MQQTNNEQPLRPYRISRILSWGHCDPAGIIYTPRALDYAVEMLEAWNRDVLGTSWVTLRNKMSLGFPTVRAELDFLKPPAVDDVIILDLEVLELGRSSMTTQVSGHDGADKVYFVVKLVSCLISVPEFRSHEILPEIRQRILAYQAVCRENSPTQN